MIKNNNFTYPSTRYSGSKRRFLDWIWENTKNLKFKSVLDVFGGTGSVSLLFKRQGKEVYYNDILKFNQIIGTALVENKKEIITDEELKNALSFNGGKYPDFIRRNFKGIFYYDSENEWLDKVIINFQRIKNKYKKAILLSALFQACLAKRPFNLFHRANLYMRRRRVQRSFGNKTTWEHPFEYLLKRFVYEYNKCIFDNGKKNKMLGGYDALICPNGVDLVYLDPPYFSASNDKGTNYLEFYHFLEGLANYNDWENQIGLSSSKINKFIVPFEIRRWISKNEIINTFKELLLRFQNNIIVFSYQSDGFPSEEEIRTMLKKLRKKTKVYRKPHKYVLSSKMKDELLFIAE